MPFRFIGGAGRLFLLAFAASGATALQFAVTGRPKTPAATGAGRFRQLDTAGANGTSLRLGDHQDATYTTNIQLNGVSIPVIIDTGSSDLWVSAFVPNTLVSDEPESVVYAIGKASGNIAKANLTMGDFTVTDQEFILVDILTDMDNSTSNGLIGLGPPQSSNIFQQDSKGSSSAGDPPLDRILAANTSLPPLLTILLDRTNSSAVSTSGAMTVGEVQPGYEAVLNQPRLPIPNGSHHWLTQLDPNGIVGPNGHPLDFNIVRGAVNGSLPVIFDSGFTVPQIPAELAALLYAQVRDAAWDARLGSWTVPCNTPFNITWRFGGVDYPIHPLDSNLSNMTDDPNVCIGGFQPISQELIDDNIFMIAGMGFLRNAYLAVNLGQADFIRAANGTAYAPAYLQLLPLTTNSTQAAAEFAAARAPPSKDGLNTPLIVGLVLGGLALLGIIAGGSIWYRRRTARGPRAPPLVQQTVTAPSWQTQWPSYSSRPAESHDATYRNA